ncbi:MAG: dockerin type I repeat-containing protein [Patescibacteria group bacterium]|jgi:hypothetical protein
MFFRSLTLLTLAILGTFGFFGIVFAQSSETINITAIVPEPEPTEELITKVIFTGIAYPGEQVTLQRAGVTIASVPADPTAHFDIGFETDPGSYAFTVYATDEEGRTSPSMSFSVTLTEGVILTVNGIFLGPSIEVEQPTYALSDTVVVFGQTAPSSQVTLFVSSDTTQTYDTVSDTNGLWSRSLLANDIGTGTHESNAKAENPDALISELSKTVTFAVEDDDLCSGKTRGDLNCDGSVNLVDFSILLFYWQQTHPANERADINDDGIVNIVDFSIMLFYWTG